MIIQSHRPALSRTLTEYPISLHMLFRNIPVKRKNRSSHQTDEEMKAWKETIAHYVWGVCSTHADVFKYVTSQNQQSHNMPHIHTCILTCNYCDNLSDTSDYKSIWKQRMFIKCHMYG